METIWIIIGVIVLVVIIYWFYQRNKTTETVIVNERKDGTITIGDLARKPITNLYVAKTSQKTPILAWVGQKNVGSQSGVNVAVK